MAALRRAAARPDERATVPPGTDLNLAKALLQIGLSTNLQEIKDSVADLRRTMARLKLEREELSEMQQSRLDATRDVKDSWRGRGYWIIDTLE